MGAYNCIRAVGQILREQKQQPHIQLHSKPVGQREQLIFGFSQEDKGSVVFCGSPMCWDVPAPAFVGAVGRGTPTTSSSMVEKASSSTVMVKMVRLQWCGYDDCCFSRW